MAIWSGYGGGLQLQRASAGAVYVHLQPGDVDAAAKRMSADRGTASLITGDQAAISLVDDSGTLLTDPLPFMAAGAWVDNARYSDGQWFVNVDPIGGIRFYTKWEDSIKGGSENAVPLLKITSVCRVRILLKAGRQKCVAQTQSWTLNTNREIVDITPLGEGFEKNMSTLVSGSGTLDCFFSAGFDQCDESFGLERSMYLHQLALRQEIGAEFLGVFLLKRSGHVVQDLSDAFDSSELFYLCNCVISNVASSVDVDEIIQSRVEFVTTDEIKLLYDYPKNYLTQEGDGLYPDLVLQENDSGILVDLPL